MAQNVGKNIVKVSVIMIIMIVGGIAVYQGFLKKSDEVSTGGKKKNKQKKRKGKKY